MMVWFFFVLNHIVCKHIIIKYKVHIAHSYTALRNLTAHLQYLDLVY